MAVGSKQEDKSSKITTLTPETRETLNHSILHYLHQSGFTKTLKRFQSEAEIKGDTWKACSVNLEDVYCKYINSCSKTEDNVDVETETKAKKKKKSKHDVASGDEVKETKPEAVSDLEVNGSNKKHKDKKKKSKEIEDVDLNIEQEVKEEKKSSKKRKRLSSDEKETNQTVEKGSTENEIDETITRKNEKPEISGEEKSGSQKSGKKQRVGSAEPKTVNAFQRVLIKWNLLMRNCKTIHIGQRMVLMLDMVLKHKKCLVK